MISDLLKSSLPEYELNLPIANKKVKFRPMTVKQEKVLLLYQNDQLENKAKAILNILSDCFPNMKNIEDMDIIDIEKCLLYLRAKSVSEQFEFGIQCPITNENIPVFTSIEKFVEVIPKQNFTIELSKELKLTMKNPKFSFYLENTKKEDTIKNLFIHCFHELHTKGDVYTKSDVNENELSEFLDAMTNKQYEKIVTFLEQIPRIENSISYKTKDGVERELTIKGIESFFGLASVI